MNKWLGLSLLVLQLIKFMAYKVTDFLIYRWRYYVGYAVVYLVGLTALLIALLFSPGGLSGGEMRSAVAANSLSFTAISPASIIDLPYHVLQWASIRVFGLSILSVKLPSFLLAIVVFIGTFGLLSYWFRRNVAIVTTILLITTGQLLFLAQYGTPSIMLMVWPVWILFAALMVSRQKQFATFWKIVMFGSAALSLYTPLSIYILLALATAIAVHPHLRYLVRTMTSWKVGVAVLCTIGLLIPLGYALIKQPSLIGELLGLPGHNVDILANTTNVLGRYVDFIHPTSSLYMTPIYGLASILLIALGFIGLLTTKYTARNYITSIWIVLLIPLVIANPSDVSVLFLPIVLLLAAGVNFLFRRWYSLFPRNPYARAAGLLPLTILLAAMVFSGVDRFMYGYTYTPGLADNFNKDLRLINHEIAQTKQPVTLAVPEKQLAFYSILNKYNPRVTVTAATPQPSGLVIVGHGAPLPQDTNNQPERIITNANRENSDRLYIYNFSKK